MPSCILEEDCVLLHMRQTENATDKMVILWIYCALPVQELSLLTWGKVFNFSVPSVVADNGWLEVSNFSCNLLGQRL